MGVEDEFEETRRAIHRMLKDAFEGKLGVFREPFIYGFTTRSREARTETARPALEGEEGVTLIAARLVSFGGHEDPHGRGKECAPKVFPLVARAQPLCASLRYAGGRPW